jgi:hypothetical protein
MSLLKAVSEELISATHCALKMETVNFAKRWYIYVRLQDAASQRRAVMFICTAARTSNLT